MLINKRNILIFLVLVGLLVQACVEPFEYETETFESALVVEATITNENKNHEVKISRSFALDGEGPAPERHAVVRVVDDALNVHSFLEESPGRYTSVSPFSAEEGRLYTLEIETTDGKIYESNPEKISGRSEIEDIYAIETTDARDVAGVAILVDSEGITGNTGHYRYEYEETFKIQSPYRKFLDIILVDDAEIQIIPKTKEEFICFRTENSNEIILGNSTSLSEDRLEGKLVRFISEDDPVLAHRYSILLRQYGLSREAYAFYENLKELSESESLFSQVQPGFLEGNVYSVENSDEKVIGYFSVSWVEEKRTFFNYEDFYDPYGRRRPSFVTYCPLETAITVQGLFNRIRSESFRFFGDNANHLQPYTTNPARYVFTRAECVDCTTLGTNEVPEFWEE